MMTAMTQWQDQEDDRRDDHGQQDRPIPRDVQQLLGEKRAQADHAGAGAAA